MSKSRWNPKLVVIYSDQLCAHLFPKGGRVTANIDGHIKHCTRDYAHQLALGMGWQLIVQPTQNAFAAAAMVIRNELEVRSRGVVE